MRRQWGQGRASSGAGQQWAGWQAEQHHAPPAAELPEGACVGASLPPFSAYPVEHNCLCLPHDQRHADYTLKQQECSEMQKCGYRAKEGGTKVWHRCGEC